MDYKKEYKQLLDWHAERMYRLELHREYVDLCNSIANCFAKTDYQKNKWRRSSECVWDYNQIKIDFNIARSEHFDNYIPVMELLMDIGFNVLYDSKVGSCRNITYEKHVPNSKDNVRIQLSFESKFMVSCGYKETGKMVPERKWDCKHI